MMKLSKVQKTSAFRGMFQSTPKEVESHQPVVEEECASSSPSSSRESSSNDLLIDPSLWSDDDNGFLSGLFSIDNDDNTMKTNPNIAATESIKEEEEESDLVMSKLANLSVEDRTDGLHDLHGVANLPEETPLFIQTKIEEMNVHLQTMAASNNIEEDPSPYYKALQLDPKYVEKIKVQCLRADLYDPKNAALRLIRFFDHKYNLFVSDGNNDMDILVRDITFEDLDSETADAVTKGFCQLLPQRDRSGRAIIMIYACINMNYSTKAVIKAKFYMHTLAVQVDEAESVQNKGFIMLFYGVGQKQKIIPGRSQLITKSKHARPCRYAAVHIWDEPHNLWERGAMNAVSKVVELQTVVRLRFHSGTHLEVIYKLMTFGITKEALPVSMDGVMDLTNHTQFLNVVRSREGIIRQMQQQQLQQQQQRLASTKRHQQQLKKQQPQQRQLASEITDLIADTAFCSPWQNQQQQQQQNHQQQSYFPLSPQPTTVRSSGTSTTSINNSLSSASSSSDNVGGQQQPTNLEAIIEQPQLVIPGPMDIIMGTRGRHPKTSPGNLRLHSTLHEFREAYDDSPKYEKVVIVEMVRKRACQSGCRFLKASDDGTTYTLGSSSDIREKISHAFRNLRRGTKTRPAKVDTISPKSNTSTKKKATSLKKKSTKRSLGE